MKKLSFIMLLAVSLFILTGAGNNAINKSSRNAKKLAKQEKVKEAVESRSYAIELDRLYLSRYGAVNLSPGRNYIIIKGNKTAINAGYMGRQRGLTPVAGIRLTGEPSVYKVEKNEAKGNYKIEMKVTAGSDTFHVSITISENGNCSASISGVKIDEARYSGNLIPVEKAKKVREPDDILI